jgi:hypothetical protein
MKGLKGFSHFQKNEEAYGKVMTSEGASLGVCMSRLKADWTAALGQCVCRNVENELDQKLSFYAFFYV